MPNLFRKLFIFGFSLVAFLFLASSHSFASTFYLSPGSGNIPSGSIKYVTVGINTAGESVNGVSAYLSYPADKLEVVSLSYGGAFPIAAEGSYGGGGVRISRGSISGFVGSGTIATIGFRGKAQGPATVAFIGGSGAPRTSNSSDSLNLGGSAGGTFTVTAPNPNATGSSQATLSIKNVVVSSVSTNSATITWQTDERTDSTVEYGLEKDNYILSSFDRVLVTDHSVTLSGNALTPGTQMHFRVKSKNSRGEEGVSSDYTFLLRGYNIRISVVDSLQLPIQNAEVTFYPAKTKVVTDANGQVEFNDVSSGRHVIGIKLPNSLEQTLKEVDVTESDTLQTFVLGIDTSSPVSSVNSIVVYSIVGGIIVIIILVGIFILLRRRRGKNNPPSVTNMGHPQNYQTPTTASF